METQRGVAVRFFVGEKATITDALNENGVGKAVMYDGGDETVVEADAAGYANFAGVIATVGAGATVSRVNTNVNQGGRDVAAGDAVGVLNDHIIEVLVTEPVVGGDFITSDEGGAFKKLTLSATADAEEVMQICGRAMKASDDEAGTVIAMIWVRK